MLGTLFRGVFLVGVVGWYSTSLWRMIDNYFKDQFKRYLEVEFEKNPKMRGDALVYTAVDNAEYLRGAHEEMQQILEACGIGADNTCPIDETGMKKRREDESVPPQPTTTTATSLPHTITAGAAAVAADAAAAVEKLSVNEVARPDEPAFHDSRNGNDDEKDAEPPDQRDRETLVLEIDNQEDLLILEEVKQLIREQQDQLELELQQHKEQLEDLQQRQEEEINFLQKVLGQNDNSQPRDQQQQMEQPQQKLKTRKKRSRSTAKSQKTGVKSEQAEKKKEKKKKIPIITLTDEDFNSVKRKRRYSSSIDRGFDEFDEEDYSLVEDYFDEEKDETGFLLADLPYKPAINVYDMERVSPDEFCPLTLEDETCDQLRSWP